MKGHKKIKIKIKIKITVVPNGISWLAIWRAKYNQKLIRLNR
jgi:hypothetical protein